MYIYICIYITNKVFGAKESMMTDDHVIGYASFKRENSRFQHLCCNYITNFLPTF